MLDLYFQKTGLQYISKEGPNISNISAKKTGFQTKQILNKEIAEEDARREALNVKVKEVRFVTKERFPETLEYNNGDKYKADMEWKIVFYLLIR